MPARVAAPLHKHLAAKLAASAGDAASETRVNGAPPQEKRESSAGTSTEDELRWALVDCGEAERRQLSMQGEFMDEAVLLLSQRYGPLVMQQVSDGEGRFVFSACI